MVRINCITAIQNGKCTRYSGNGLDARFNYLAFLCKANMGPNNPRKSPTIRPDKKTVADLGMF